MFWERVLFCSAINITASRIDFRESYVKKDVINFLGSSSFLCLLGSRMFFNLKEAAELQANGGMSQLEQGPVSLYAASDLQFAMPDCPSSGT